MLLSRFTLLLSIAAAIGCSIPAEAQSNGNACSSILRAVRAGLYVSYPSGRITMINSSSGRAAADGGREEDVPYDPDAELYFVPGSGSHLFVSGEEGVWHVRTQTQATAASGADQALVYRPSVVTRCSNGSALAAFDENDRLVSLRRYVDHHAPPEGDYRRDTGLGQYFHFQIEDPGNPKHCIPTDDRSGGRNTAEIFGFEGVTRTQQRVAQYLSFVGSAYAQVATAYAGLSSEFAYHNAPEPACLRFTIPLPTNSVNNRSFFSFSGPTNEALARMAAREWNPVRTSVMIKQLRGRQTFVVYSTGIRWAANVSRR